MELVAWEDKPWKSTRKYSLHEVCIQCLHGLYTQLLYCVCTSFYLNAGKTVLLTCLINAVAARRATFSLTALLLLEHTHFRCLELCLVDYVLVKHLIDNFPVGFDFLLTCL